MKPFSVVEPYKAKNGAECYISLLVSYYNNCSSFLVSQYDARLHFCGYVIVKDKELFEKLHKDYNETSCATLSVHGGITYCESFYDKGNAVGFDCAHGGDSLDKCDKDYVKLQLDLLAEQLYK